MIKKLLVLILSVILLCGCSDKKDYEELTFASWGSITEVNVLRKIIADFEKDNPKIKINFLHIPQNYFQKIHLLFASGTSPDVIFINNLYLPIYASKLCDLSDYVNKDDFYSQALNGLSYEGKLLAIPRDVSNMILYVNTDIIPTVPKNWTLEDLLSIAKLSSRNGIYGISFEEDIYWILPYLYYYGEKFDDDFDIENSKGLRFYMDLRDKYKVAPTKSQVGSSTLAQMFLDKKVAMYLSGRWMYPIISTKADFNWIVVPFPKGIGALACDSSGWAISKNSKHKESAMRFVKYLSEQKGAGYFADTGLIVPARKKTAQKLNNTNHNERAFLEIIENSNNTVVTKHYKKITDKFNKQIFSL